MGNREWAPANWTFAVLAFLTSLCVASPAEAGLVYGQVFAEGATVEPGDVLELFDSKGNPLPLTIRVGQGGAYSVNLPEGVFRVRLKKHPTFEGGIWSYPRPAKQDLYLRRR